MISKVVRDALDKIDAIISKCDEDAYDLWLILTALRGPDNENLDKVYTTAVVRAAAFPLTVGDRDSTYPYSSGYRCFGSGGVSSAPLFNKQTFVVTPPDSRKDTHFYSHLEEAAIRLGLEIKQQT